MLYFAFKAAVGVSEATFEGKIQQLSLGISNSAGIGGRKREKALWHFSAKLASCEDILLFEPPSSADH